MPLHHRHQSGLLTQGRLGPSFMLLASKTLTLLSMCLIKIHQIRLCFSSLQLYSFGEPQPTPVSVSCSCLTEVEPNMVFCCCRPSALQFDVFCVLTRYSAHHNRLFIRVAEAFSVSSNQSGHSPLTFSSTRHFGVQNCPSLDLTPF